MVSLAKLLRIRQSIGEKYKNIGLEKFHLSIICRDATTFSSQTQENHEISVKTENTLWEPDKPIKRLESI
jgi:hypothetical protein